MSQFKSAIYKGHVRHRRFEPKGHEFSYPVFMMWLDLDELPRLIKQRWYWSENGFNFVSYRREDFYAPEQDDLKQAVIDRIANDVSEEQANRISSVRALLHLRYLNIVFNPVVFYYCYDANDALVAILAEITNTPWGERHAYTLPIGEQKNGNLPEYAIRGKLKHQFEFSKQFHVSPFNPMNMDYRWVFSEPGEKLFVHMDNFLQAANESEADKHFDATLVLKRQNIETEFGKTLIQMPLMTVKVVWGIYWQALKLKLKGVPFYDHPQGSLENK